MNKIIELGRNCLRLFFISIETKLINLHISESSALIAYFFAGDAKTIKIIEMLQRIQDCKFVFGVSEE